MFGHYQKDNRTCPAFRYFGQRLYACRAERNRIPISQGYARWCASSRACPFFKNQQGVPHGQTLGFSCLFRQSRPPSISVIRALRRRSIRCRRASWDHPGDGGDRDAVFDRRGYDRSRERSHDGQAEENKVQMSIRSVFVTRRDDKPGVRVCARRTSGHSTRSSSRRVSSPGSALARRAPALLSQIGAGLTSAPCCELGRRRRLLHCCYNPNDGLVTSLPLENVMMLCA